ncbi:5542_t:CDS:2 [Diversispora eburnea]|uniref:5542_t:CDS:1 n=1 Tax=Diversispora eburnea TaxID=1213867 RepID=A0A9N8YN54_9GLOM|nr:5542_t:CDS:2 [Diversispora eburnea]
MSTIASPNQQRKQSNASVELSEQTTPRGTKRELEDEEDMDSAEEETGTKNEKRAGRRKIKIEYIDDKSRRHITFSTQVLLLVVSETGLVYTFTTPKLQPLVTKPEGKNLIQACLNAPDAPSGQESPTTARTTQNAPVYGNDNSAPVDNNNNDVYDNDRKSQPYAIGLNPYNQYGMSLGNSGIAAPPYMPAAGYPQYNQQHLNQYTSNNAYMPAAGYWSTSNTAPNGTKVTQYPNQSPEKK